MEILTQHLPSGGYGYSFPSITIKPMTFIEVVGYLESVPTDKLSKYLFDIKWLAKDDPNIYNCYVMDLDYLIFMKKIITISNDTTISLSFKCSECGKAINEKILINKLKFKAADDIVLEGADVEINGKVFSIKPPTVKEFLNVFDKYLRYRKIEDLDTIKLISLVSEFDNNPNAVENIISSATYEGITMLLMLKELYFDRVEPIEISCPHCNEGRKEEERRYQTVRIDKLIVDFFRDISENNRLDPNKIKFKQNRVF